MKSTIIVGFVFLFVALGCGNFGKAGKRSAGSLNPYRGELVELLPAEFSNDGLKFKLVGSLTDTPSQGGTKAQRFTYNQEAMGITVQIDGRLENFASADAANAAITKISQKYGGTLTKKGGGQRFLGEDKSLVWTNGSILCFVKGSVAKGAVNFEEAAPF